MRADQLLFARGLAASRAQAQALIADGVNWRPSALAAWQAVRKNGEDLPTQAELQVCSEQHARYVSRGALKLAAALHACAIAPSGWLCLDVGQSTGGFTDCLLQAGAARVVGVDVGHDQLHPKLRTDARVFALEGVNARTLSATDLRAAYASQTGDTACFDLIVMDVSFISQTLIWPRLPALMRAGGWLISLVKPQFELQAAQVGKGGVVRDPSLYATVRARIEATAQVCAVQQRFWLDSPIAGGDGNHEFLFCGQKAL